MSQTFASVLMRVDTLYPNDMTNDEKLVFAHDLERKIYREIISPCLLDQCPELAESSTPIAGDDYLPMYWHYVIANIAQIYGETDRYNNEAAMFNSMYASYRNFYNRTHRRESGVSQLKVM